jgi:hypothetical protein
LRLVRVPELTSGWAEETWASATRVA